MIAVMLALLLAQGMTDADYDAARLRENPTVAQAAAVVAEARRRAAWGDVVIVNVEAARRGECVIEADRRMTCVRSTRMSPTHFDFAPPAVYDDGGPLDVGAIIAAERAWVGLSPLP